MSRKLYIRPLANYILSDSFHILAGSPPDDDDFEPGGDPTDISGGDGHGNAKFGGGFDDDDEDI